MNSHFSNLRIQIRQDIRFWESAANPHEDPGDGDRGMRENGKSMDEWE